MRGDDSNFSAALTFSLQLSFVSRQKKVDIDERKKLKDVSVVKAAARAFRPL